MSASIEFQQVNNATMQGRRAWRGRALSASSVAECCGMCGSAVSIGNIITSLTSTIRSTDLKRTTLFSWSVRTLFGQGNNHMLEYTLRVAMTLGIGHADADPPRLN